MERARTAASVVITMAALCTCTARTDHGALPTTPVLGGFVDGGVRDTDRVGGEGVDGDVQILGDVGPIPPFGEEAILTHPDVADPDDFFGDGVSIADGYVVVGAPRDDTHGVDAGIAFVYELSAGEWQLADRLPGLSQAGRWFGEDVDVDGDTIVVGADRSNKVFVYSRDASGWQEIVILTASGASPGGFGNRVAIHADTITVSAPFEDVGGEVDAGVLYVYSLSSGQWTEQARLMPPSSLTLDKFGSRHAIFGDRVVAKGEANQAVHLLTQAAGAWSYDGTLASTDPMTVGPSSFSLDDAWMAVGLGRYDSVGVDSGAVFVFTRLSGVWEQHQILIPGDNAAGDRFGTAVSLRAGRLVVGAPFHAATAVGAGAAYVYHLVGNDWVETHKFLASDGGVDDGLGTDVATDGVRAVVGAERAQGARGKAYVLNLGP